MQGSPPDWELLECGIVFLRFRADQQRNPSQCLHFFTRLFNQVQVAIQCQGRRGRIKQELQGNTTKREKGNGIGVAGSRN